jgi:hypothetical protein
MNRIRLSTSHPKIFDNEDRKKRDDAKLIQRINMVGLDWFRSSHGVTAIHPVFAVLCCLDWLPQIDCGLLLL